MEDRYVESLKVGGEVCHTEHKFPLDALSEMLCDILCMVVVEQLQKNLK